VLSQHRDEIKSFLVEESRIPKDWDVKIWLFILRENAMKVVDRLKPAYIAKITYLEDATPWHHSKGYRKGEPMKPYPELPLEYQ
jgi:hypothetical protein